MAFGGTIDGSLTQPVRPKKNPKKKKKNELSGIEQSGIELDQHQSSTHFFLFFSFHGSHVGFAFISFFFFFLMCNRYLCLFSGQPDWRAKRTKLRKEMRGDESERLWGMSGGRGNKAEGNQDDGKQKERKENYNESGWGGKRRDGTDLKFYIYLHAHTYILTYLHTTRNTTMSPTDLYTFTLYIYICHQLPPFLLTPSRRVYCTTFATNPVSLQLTTRMMT